MLFSLIQWEGSWLPAGLITLLHSICSFPWAAEHISDCLLWWPVVLTACAQVSDRGWAKIVIRDTERRQIGHWIDALCSTCSICRHWGFLYAYFITTDVRTDRRTDWGTDRWIDLGNDHCIMTTYVDMSDMRWERKCVLIPSSILHFSSFWIVFLSPQRCHQAVIHPCIMEDQPGASWELLNSVTDTIYEGWEAVMESDSYTSGPATTDWAGMVAGLEGTGVLEEQEGGGSSNSPASWLMPYSLGFQVPLTAFLMLELVLGFSSNLTVLVLYCSQSNLVDSVSNMVTVNLHVLDVAVCVLCLPLTLVVVLLPPGPNLALLCCFHEACVTFASIATAINILVISMDRYDISVRPANRMLTTRRAALLLAAVWVTSVAVFFIPFLEEQWSSGDGAEVRGQGTPLSLSSRGISATVVPAWRNQTLLCIGGQGFHIGQSMYYHLILQVPIFFVTVAVMLFTYSRILRALNIRIGSHMKKSQRFKGPSCGGRHKKQKKKKAGVRMNDSAEGGGGGEQCTTDGTKQHSHPPLIPPPPPPPPTPPPPPPTPFPPPPPPWPILFGPPRHAWHGCCHPHAPHHGCPGLCVGHHCPEAGSAATQGSTWATKAGVQDVPHHYHHLPGLLGSPLCDQCANPWHRPQWHLGQRTPMVLSPGLRHHRLSPTALRLHPTEATPCPPCQG